MLNTQGPLSLWKDNLYVNNQPPQCKSTRKKRKQTAERVRGAGYSELEKKKTTNKTQKLNKQNQCI